MKPSCSVSRLALATVVASGCGASPAHPIPVAVLIEGEIAPPLPEVEGLRLHALVIPPAPAAPPDDTAVPLARARAAYAGGDFETCRAELAKIEVPRVLASGARDVAARALAFDAACAWGQQAQAQARGVAARLAGYGLAIPDTAIAPDIEAVLGDAIVTAGNARTHTVAVHGEPGARLRVDGKPPACALPCQVELVPGAHVLAVSADGFADAMTEVRIPDSTNVEIRQPPATPAVAAAQWRARAGRGLPAADAIGARLIAQLGGERRIAVLSPRADATSQRGAMTGAMTGAMVVDGSLAASATAPPGDRAGLIRELAYDAGVLHRPAVWQRPWFWIAISGVALGAAAAITAITYQPTHHVSLTL